MPWPVDLETAAAAVAFALAFLLGSSFQPFSRTIASRNATLSFFGGMSSAYVFVHMMPELERARGDWVTFGRVRLFNEGIGVYFLALVGFMAFYGLNHLRGSRTAESTELPRRVEFRLHLGEFAAYVWMIAYLLVNNPHQSAETIVLYTVAMCAHFLGIDHSLNEEHGDLYQRVGRYVLAATALVGWGMGVLLPMPRDIVALLVAFLSGAIIMNAALMELPSTRQERFLWFVAGGVIYGLLLVWL